MIERYMHSLGTNFGYKTTGTKAQMIFHGLYSDCHSYRDLGLLPKEKPVIEAPSLRMSSIVVPGRDGDLDTSEAIDGMMHYGNRKGTFRFTAVDGRQTWDSLYYLLLNRLHGKRKQIVIDEAPDGYYVGRLSVSDRPEYDDKTGKAIFTVTADLQPFKYMFHGTDGDWLWDPFSFEHGVIRDYGHLSITNGVLSKTFPSTWKLSDDGELTIIGSKIAVMPVVNLKTGSVSVAYPGGTMSLSSGDNTLPFILYDDSVTLTFSGTGTFSIAYDTAVI